MECIQDLHKNCDKDIQTTSKEMHAKDQELKKLKQTMEVQVIQIQQLTQNQLESNEQIEKLKSIV